MAFIASFSNLKKDAIYLIRAHGTNFCIDNYNRIDEGNVHA